MFLSVISISKPCPERSEMTVFNSPLWCGNIPCQPHLISAGGQKLASSVGRVLSAKRKNYRTKNLPPGPPLASKLAFNQIIMLSMQQEGAGQVNDGISMQRNPIS